MRAKMRTFLILYSCLIFSSISLYAKAQDGYLYVIQNTFLVKVDESNMTMNNFLNFFKIVDNVAVDETHAWVLTAENAYPYAGTLHKIRKSDLVSEGTVTFDNRTGLIVVDTNFVWVTEHTTNKLHQIDKATGDLIQSYDINTNQPYDMVVDNDHVWLTNGYDALTDQYVLAKINKATRTLTNIPMPTTLYGGFPKDLHVDANQIWMYRVYANDPNLPNNIWEIDKQNLIDDNSFTTTSSFNVSQNSSFLSMVQNGSDIWLPDGLEGKITNLNASSSATTIVSLGNNRYPSFIIQNSNYLYVSCNSNAPSHELIKLNKSNMQIANIYSGSDIIGLCDNGYEYDFFFQQTPVAQASGQFKGGHIAANAFDGSLSTYYKPADKKKGKINATLPTTISISEICMYVNVLTQFPVQLKWKIEVDNNGTWTVISEGTSAILTKSQWVCIPLQTPVDALRLRFKFTSLWVPQQNNLSTTSDTSNSWYLEGGKRGKFGIATILLE